MNNAMVKRGIGAIVLAIIAALLLGWLLKDKSNQRQKVVEMDIPSLTDPIQMEANSGTTPLDNEKSLLDRAKDSEKETGAAVIIASATGAADTLTKTADSALSSAKTSISDVAENISTMKPGFAIRPSSKNEEKEIIDNTQSNSPALKEKELTKQANNAKDAVVASTANTTKKVEKVFKPQIVEKKKIAKKPTPKPKKVVVKKKEQIKAKIASTETKTTAPSISTVPIGKYSVQLLATSSQSRANKLAKTMKSEGYQVFVTQTTRNAKILYRVRIGGHRDRNEAIKAQAGMKKRYQKNFFIQNSLVVSN